MKILSQYFSDFTLLQKEQFAKLEPLYREWNAKINVISRKDLDSLYEKHVLHSLAIATVFSFTPGIEIIDMGTGGGFPGIPLAIFFPEVRFVLADSVGKKIKVVNEIISGLELKNAETYHGRVESIKTRKFDFAVSRAVAPLKDLWNWCRPLLRKERKLEDFKNGLICLKGGDLSREIAESGLKPYQWDLSEIFNLPYYQEKYMLYVPV